MALFNPDYVEVERVLDIKIYNRLGEVITEDVLNNRLTSTGELNPVEAKKQAKRERERNRARAKKAAKAKEAAAVAAAKEEKDDAENGNDDAEEAPIGTPNTEEAELSPHVATSAADKEEEEHPPSHLRPPSSVDSSSRPTDNAKIADDEGEGEESEQTETDPQSVDNNPKLQLEGDEDEDVEDKTEQDDDNQPATVTYYLVKWRSLPYEEATWELAEDVDRSKVKEYMKIRNPPKEPPAPRDSNYKVNFDWDSYIV